ELDRLVILGLLQIRNMTYLGRGRKGARMEAEYSLNFESTNLPKILEALGARSPESALDASDVRMHIFLLGLAEALATVNDADIDDAATVDVTYADQRFDYSNIVDFGEWTENVYEDNLSLRTISDFDRYMPEGVSLSGGQRLYMY